MSLQTDVLATSFLIIVVLGSSWSGTVGPMNNSTVSSEKQPTNNSTPTSVPTAANNRTNRSVESTAATLQSNHTREPGSTTYATMPRILHKTSASPRTSSVHVTLISSASPRASSVHVTLISSASPRAANARVVVMSILLALVISLSAVAIVAAVFFFRWKRKKKMIKEGFQEEMATICLHDELASEALYSSWKPFMDTNESNGKMKLVIQPTDQDAQNTQANSSTLSS